LRIRKGGFDVGSPPLQLRREHKASLSGSGALHVRNPSSPYPFDGAEVGGVVVVELDLQVLDRAIDRNGAVGSGHGGGDGRGVAAEEFLEKLEGFEKGCGDGESREVVLKSFEEKGLLEAGIEARNGESPKDIFD